MSKHTPGPWIATKQKYENDSGGSFDIDAESGKYIAETIGGLFEEESNARLIAAAPDLLESLRGFIEHGTCFDADDWAKAKAAIAKATGETK